MPCSNQHQITTAADILDIGLLMTVSGQWLMGHGCLMHSLGPTLARAHWHRAHNLDVASQSLHQPSHTQQQPCSQAMYLTCVWSCLYGQLDAGSMEMMHSGSCVRGLVTGTAHTLSPCLRPACPVQTTLNPLLPLPASMEACSA